MVVDQLASIGHSLLHLCIWFSNFPFSVVYRYETAGFVGRKRIEKEEEESINEYSVGQKSLPYTP